MKESEKRFIKKWTLRRKQGKNNYLVRSALLLTIVFFLAFAYLAPLVNNLFAGREASFGLSGRFTAGHVISAILYGVVMSFYTWSANESRFAKLTGETTEQ